MVVGIRRRRWIATIQQNKSNSNEEHREFGHGWLNSVLLLLKTMEMISTTTLQIQKKKLYLAYT